MPSGYTEMISRGVSFQEFALGCARAFGATISMRDDPPDAPIPDEFEPSDYHLKKIEDAKARLYDLQRMTPDEIRTAAEKAGRELVAYWTGSNDRKAELRAKYEAMLAEVESWTPPTPEHEGMKKFMRDQITESIRWDCSSSGAPEPKDAPAWHAEQIALAERDIAYHTKEHAEEVERCRQRTEWVRALRRSLENQ